MRGRLPGRLHNHKHNPHSEADHEGQAETATQKAVYLSSFKRLFIFSKTIHPADADAEKEEK
jgi:hypothetical protein